MMKLFTLLAITFLTTSLMQEEEQPIDFLLSAEKPVYVVCEPLRLTFAFVNEKDEPIKGYFGVTFDNSELKVYYRREGEPFRPYYSKRMEMAETTETIYLPITIPAHGEISHSETLLYDIKTELLLPIHKRASERWVFDQPGRYEFQAKFWLKPLSGGDVRILESNIVQVTVVRPSKTEEEALTFWKDKDIALAIQGDGFTAGAIKKLAMFLERFPTSLYTSYARERLIGYLRRRAERGKLTGAEKRIYESFRP